MPTRIEMPELSSDGEGAALATWLVSVGDRVEKGDVIAEIETDKSTLELEAPASGTITRFEIEEGAEDIQPGTLLALLEAEAEAKPEAEVGESPSVSEIDPSPPPPPPATEAGSLRTSTPLARRAAKDRDIDVSTLEGSGPGGRVVEEDVLRSAESGSASALTSTPAVAAATTSSASVDDRAVSFETRPLSAMRRTIARRLAESKREVPHFYLSRRCSMDAVFEARLELNREVGEAGPAISVNDFVVLAAARALREVPEANVSFIDADGDARSAPELRIFERVDISVAVATDGGLVTPVVRDADRKGLAGIAAEVKELALLAREGKLRPEQYQGGSFTISNLGMYGIESVYPILNPPQACILGVGAAREEPVVRQGEVGIGRVAVFTLAADHRAIDGAVGARLLAALCERLEEPLAMLL